MKRKQAVSVEPDGPAEVRTRIPVWLYPSTLGVMDRAAETANRKSRGEYLEKAALFYAGYVSGQDTTCRPRWLPSCAVRCMIRRTASAVCCSNWR